MLQHPIELLGLTKQKTDQFLNKGITSVEELAYFFPRKYVDFRQIKSIKDCSVGDMAALRGTVTGFSSSVNMHTAFIEEPPCPGLPFKLCFSVVWFGTDYYINMLEVGKEYVFCGKLTEFRGHLQINAPLAFGPDPSVVCRIFPIYSKIQRMSSEYLDKQIQAAIAYLRVNDKGGEKEVLASSLGLMNKYEAIQEMHQPTDGMRFKQA